MWKTTGRKIQQTTETAILRVPSLKLVRCLSGRLLYDALFLSVAPVFLVVYDLLGDRRLSLLLLRRWQCFIIELIKEERRPWRSRRRQINLDGVSDRSVLNRLDVFGSFPLVAEQLL